jgi:hypothetical protein
VEALIKAKLKSTEEKLNQLRVDLTMKQSNFVLKERIDMLGIGHENN